jgi:branched-chain amino acid transport system permease protein
MSLPSGVFNESYGQDMGIIKTKSQWIILAIMAAVLISMPKYAGDRLLTILITTGITIVALHGLNILTGYSGQISLGHAGFMAVGAYASAALCTKLGWSFWAALPSAMIIAGIIGIIFGLPSLKIKGFYLIMSTVAAYFIIIWFINHFRSITGGPEGIPAPTPTLFGFSFSSKASYYYLVLFFVILVTLITINLVRSRIGRAFIAIRDNEKAAEVMGVNLFFYKLLAFFIGCLFAGLAGVLTVHYSAYASPDFFPFMNSVWFLGMIIVGGQGSISGVFFGAIALTILDEVVTIIGPGLSALGMVPQVAASLGLVFRGLLIILFLIFEPKGLAHRWEMVSAYFKKWPFTLQKKRKEFANN